MNKPNIFLLEEDNDTRPIFKRLLEKEGYNVLLSVEEEDALQRVNDGLMKSDLIMINLLGKSEMEMLDFGNLLREKAGLNVPVIAVAAKYNDELEGTTAQVGDNQHIIYLGDGNELFDLLSGLIGTKPSDSK